MHTKTINTHQPTLYGIPACTTVKKARAYLDAKNIAYTFHDYKKQGITPMLLRSFILALGWEKLVNKAGTTWRNLPESDKANLTETKAIKLMLANPSLIKRPVTDWGNGKFTVGFDETTFAGAASTHS